MLYQLIFMDIFDSSLKSPRRWTEAGAHNCSIEQNFQEITHKPVFAW